MFHTPPVRALLLMSTSVGCAFLPLNKRVKTKVPEMHQPRFADELDDGVKLTNHNRNGDFQLAQAGFTFLPLVEYYRLGQRCALVLLRSLLDLMHFSISP